MSKIDLTQFQEGKIDLIRLTVW